MKRLLILLLLACAVPAFAGSPLMGGGCTLGDANHEFHCVGHFTGTTGDQLLIYWQELPSSTSRPYRPVATR